MVIFTDYGYSPSNFAALVEAAGAASKAQFMRDNTMSKSAFYRYMTGETSLSWIEWQALATKYGYSVCPLS